MTTAIIVATAASHDPAGGPCALLQAGDTTLLGRLVDQLRLLGVARATVLTRTGWAGAVAEAVPNGTAVVAVDSLAADAQAVAGAIEAAPGETTLLLDADVACHTGAITGLLWDPKIESGALTSRARRFASHPEITIARGRIAHAASPFHSAPSPNSRSLGVVKIGPGQAADVVAALRTVASTAFAESPGIRERIDRRSRGYLSSFTAREAGHVVGLDIVRRHPDLEWLPTPVEIEDEVDRRFCVEVVRRRDEDQRAIVDVVLVALVRSGTTVRPAYLRSFAFARPRSACAAIAAIEARDVLDEDAITLRNAVKSTDGFFTTFFVSPYSRYLARWAARRGLTPNQVTCASLALGLAAAIAFAVGTRAWLVTGALLLQVSFTLDCVDGQLARYTRTFSKFGGWLDSVFDRAKECAVFAGLAIGDVRLHGGDSIWLLAIAAISLQTVRHLLDFSFAAGQHDALDDVVYLPVTESDPLVPWSPQDPHAIVDRPVGGTSTAASNRPGAMARGARAILRGSRRIGELPGGVWIKRMIAFPIGERFALISLTAALFDARVTFIAVLVWGGFALAYTSAGRVMRSVL